MTSLRNTVIRIELALYEPEKNLKDVGLPILFLGKI
jgi:hypothetical protein